LLTATACAAQKQAPVSKPVSKKAAKTAPKSKPAPKSANTEKPSSQPREVEDLEALEANVRSIDQPVAAACEKAVRATIKKPADFIWPVDGVVISGFGKREGAPHDGIDIGAPIGTAIYASRAGVVLYSGERPGYGQMVIIGHDAERVTIYAHNEKNCVEVGARVEQGEPVALVGKTGGATSPAVHFEVRVEQKPVNPRAHLPE
jgi:murein DD-endopeptidase MepM/ murein hydrolase activator NlpD